MNVNKNRKKQISDLRRTFRTKWRKYTYNGRPDIKIGDVVETCNLHIGIVTVIDKDSASFTTRSFFTGGEGDCDMYHCGVVRQSSKQIIEKMTLFQTGGINALRDLWDKRCRLGTF